MDKGRKFCCWGCARFSFSALIHKKLIDWERNKGIERGEEGKKTKAASSRALSLGLNCHQQRHFLARLIHQPHFVAALGMYVAQLLGKGC